MFWNIYSKRLISTLRDKSTLVWTWVFPLVMATLFYFAFTSLDSVDQFHTIPAAVVAEGGEQEAQAFRQVLESVSEQEEDQLFSLQTTASREEAEQLLDQGKIDGFFMTDNQEPTLFVKKNGLNQTIMKAFLDQYLQDQEAVITIIHESPEQAGNLQTLFSRESFTKEISLAENPPTNKINYFYALIAMVCLYGSFQGLTSVSCLQANLSPLGARRCLSPVSRFVMVSADLLAGVTAHMLSLLVLLAYLILVLNVNFGGKTALILLTSLAGCVTGVSFGALVSVCTKMKEAAKTAVLVSVSLACCFLAGLMVSGINYTVAKNAPVLAWINPAARITDAFYCLYYYDTYDQYFLNILVLLLMAAVMTGLTAIFLRRQQYESI